MAKGIIFVYDIIMNKRRITLCADLLVMLFFVALPFNAGAQGVTAKDLQYSSLQREEQLCRQLKDKITNKQDTRKFVKASIQMGYNACGVIKCAINGGGDLKQVIEGAVEAGTTKDVVSRCALDAGADARDVGLILLAGLEDCNGLGYSQQEETNIIIPENPDRKRFISPSHF